MYTKNYIRKIGHRRSPAAFAQLRGSSEYPSIRGIVRFYPVGSGVLVEARIAGLPSPAAVCESPVFGFHLHEGELCAPSEDDPFGQAGGHYNPEGCLHPHHAGDFPPLFGVRGNAFTLFLTDRFTVGEIIGKTVIIHSAPDDFTTQPAGNSGRKIACGRIIAAHFSRNFG